MPSSQADGALGVRSQGRARPLTPLLSAAQANSVYLRCNSPWGQALQKLTEATEWKTWLGIPRFLEFLKGFFFFLEGLQWPGLKKQGEEEE